MIIPEKILDMLDEDAELIEENYNEFLVKITVLADDWVKKKSKDIARLNKEAL